MLKCKNKPAYILHDSSKLHDDLSARLADNEIDGFGASEWKETTKWFLRVTFSIEPRGVPWNTP